MRIRVLEAGQAIGFQQLVCSPPRLGGVSAANLETELRVLQHRAPLEQMILLQQDTHPLVGAANAHTIEQDLSFRRLQQTGNDAQQGGFPAAARPHDAAELAVADRQVQVLERQRLSDPGEISVGQAFAPDSLPSAHRLIV